MKQEKSLDIPFDATWNGVTLLFDRFSLVPQGTIINLLCTDRKPYFISESKLKHENFFICSRLQENKR